MSGPTHHGFFNNPINASSIFQRARLFSKKTAPGVARQRSSSAMMRMARPIVPQYGRQKVRKRLWMEARRQSGGTVERNDYGPRVRHLLGNNATRDENIVNATRTRATPPVLPSVATYPSRAPPLTERFGFRLLSAACGTLRYRLVSTG